MALVILTEQRDFVGAGVGVKLFKVLKALRLRSFSVTPCNSADTA